MLNPKLTRGTLPGPVACCRPRSGTKPRSTNPQHYNTKSHLGWEDTDSASQEISPGYPSRLPLLSLRFLEPDALSGPHDQRWWLVHFNKSCCFFSFWSPLLMLNLRPWCSFTTDVHKQENSHKSHKAVCSEHENECLLFSLFIFNSEPTSEW